MEAPLEWLPWVSVAVLAIIIIQMWSKNYNVPPGPWGWPIVGSYFDMEQYHYRSFMELYEKYGEVFSFRSFGGNRFIVLNGIAAIREVLVSRADEFIGRPLQNNFLKWIDDGYGIAQEEGTAWKEQRRFFISTSKVHGFGKLDLEEYIHERIQEIMVEIKKHGSKPIDIHRYLSYASCNVISKVLSGKSFSMGDSKFNELNQKLLEMVLVLADRRMLLIGRTVDLLMSLTSDGRDMNKTKMMLEKLTDEIIDEHVETIDYENPRDFVDSYLIHIKSLEDKGELKNSSFSITRLRKVFLGMFIEGTITISSTMVSLLNGLSKHLDVQKKAQEILDDVVGRERLPSWSDKRNLPYIDALVLELFRTSLVFAVSSYYSNFEKTTIRGYNIPKRSLIVANLYSVNNDPKAYPEPSRFDPCRFLTEDGRRLKQELPVPFGVGKRSCAGEALAQMEVFLFISTILQNFTVHPAEDFQLRLVPREP